MAEAALTNLHDIYLAELQELRSAEDLMTEALPQLASRATNSALVGMLNEDAGETRSHSERLDTILARHGSDGEEHRDQSMGTLLAEARKWVAMIDDPQSRDAALIASAQRLQHYEIAIYGSLVTWARQLGYQDDVPVLLEILEDEKQADRKLSELATNLVNPAAA
jgi:ferritin-like metal-binding protein YciE